MLANPAYQTITAETHDRVGILTLNRPERLNAWNPQMVTETLACLDAWADDPAIGAIVLTGAGRAFSAGADFAETFAPEADGRAPESNDAERWISAVHRTKPIVVAFNGVAVGMGLTFALPCALRLAATQARLSMRFVRVGLVPEVASTTLLPQIIGAGWANEMCLTGRFVSAQDALQIGLVNHVYPPDDLLPAAIALAAEIAGGPTRVVMLAKRLLEDDAALPWRTAVAHETIGLRDARSGPEHRESIAAFAEKREPRFNA